MKKIFLFTFFAFALYSFSFYSENMNKIQGNDQGIMLAFVTYNDYGNNLYIDNLTFGERKNIDLAVASLENIPPDTSYTINSVSDTIAPVVNVANLGQQALPDSTAFIYLEIFPSGYFDSVYIPSISAGSVEPVTFPDAVLNASTKYDFTIYIYYPQDINYFNDTLTQSSIIFPGVQRRVLFEQFTSMASISAANNNPGVTVFSHNNHDSLCIVKYHIDSPLGVDSLFFDDSVSITSRFNYYNPLSIPMLYIDGNIRAGFPYNDTTKLGIPFRKRLSKATPVSLSVTEERIGADSIRAAVNFEIISPVKAGDYKLRVYAVQKLVSYEEPPGSNGETEFYDVFRAAVTDADGLTINTAPGNYEYTFTYFRNESWDDSKLYTLAFIQNDVTKEVINSAKGRNIILPDSGIPLSFNSHDPVFSYLTSSNDSVNAFHAELFESSFPPSGWKIQNADALITFDKFTGANGNSFGGESSMYMNFYNYNTRGEWDTIYTRIYLGIKSTDTLRFDYAYAKYDAFHIDSLIVLASTDGGQTFPHVIFQKGGDSLATRVQTTSNFIPNSNNWRTFKYPLTTVIQDQFAIQNVPVEYELYQNYPNPFNPSTTIRFSLMNSSELSLKVYDITGREIKQIANGFFDSGAHEVVFNAEGLSSGIYFYILKSGNFTQSKKMILLR